MQAKDGSIQRVTADPPASLQHPNSTEERRLRIRSALEAATRLTSEVVEEDEEDFDAMIQHFPRRERH